ncbi:hypothetical protein C0J52_19787 [Blattella germanica]|nr:hypothetical protein C0J52_19787 [Blattella germanica]
MESEVNGIEDSITEKEDDSRSAGQVTSSGDRTHELADTGNPGLLPSGAAESYYNSSYEQNKFQEVVTSNIMQSINQMMETLTINLQNSIKEEVKKYTQKEKSSPQQKHVPAIPNADTGRGNEIQTRSPPTPPSGELAQVQEQEWTPDLNEGAWRQVTYNRGRRPTRKQTAMTGAGPRDEDLQAVDKMAWLFLGRLKPQTTPNTVKNFLEKKGITENVICEKLTTIGDTTAFKLGIPFSHLDKANDA